MREVLIVAGARTPFGRFGGTLKDLTAVDLGAAATREAMLRADVEGQAIQHVILGNCMGAATLGQVPARQAALKAGLPDSIPTMAINTACTSALQAAKAAGKFSDEIVPVEVQTRKGKVVVSEDEQPRPDTTYEKLAALPPAFEPKGTVTAGNAPGLNDGAAALVLMSRQTVETRGLELLARIVATASAAATPRLINVVPTLAAQNALQKAKMQDHYVLFTHKGETMLNLQHILAAQRNLNNLTARTPLEYSFLLSQQVGCEVYLKLESWQKTGSFKVRGAINKVASLTEDEKARGLVTASAGNHALGVAYAARALGSVPTTLFVPVNAPASKLKKLEGFDCEVLLSGNSYDEAHHAAEDFERAHGATYVHAYDDPLTIAGQGTVGLEIMEDLPEAEAILVPVGGGGLITGIAVAAKAINPQVRIIGVQPEASPAAYLSLRDGRPYEEYDAAPTIADGLAGGFGRLPFEIAGHLIDEIVLVSEEETRAAVFTLLELAQLVVEGSGAVGIAALLAGKVNLAGRKAAVVLSGANIDASLLFEIMDEQSET